jgi:hypothetical protein
VAAFPSQRQRDLATDSASAAGDQRDASRGRRQGLSAQKKKNIGRLIDWLSRAGSDRQRTVGDCALFCDESPPETVSQPPSATSKTSGASECRGHFMRPF